MDMHPGDRANECKGFMEPIGIATRGNEYDIEYRCTRCHELHTNKALPEDNHELLIELSAVNKKI